MLHLHHVNLLNENIGHSTMNTKKCDVIFFQKQPSLMTNPSCRPRVGLSSSRLHVPSWAGQRDFVLNDFKTVTQPITSSTCKHGKIYISRPRVPVEFGHGKHVILIQIGCSITLNSAMTAIEHLKLHNNINNYQSFNYERRFL